MITTNNIKAFINYFTLIHKIEKTTIYNIEIISSCRIQNDKYLILDQCYSIETTRNDIITYISALTFIP